VTANDPNNPNLAVVGQCYFASTTDITVNPPDTLGNNKNTGTDSKRTARLLSNNALSPSRTTVIDALWWLGSDRTLGNLGLCGGNSSSDYNGAFFNVQQRLETAGYFAGGAPGNQVVRCDGLNYVANAGTELDAATIWTGTGTAGYLNQTGLPQTPDDCARACGWHRFEAAGNQCSAWILSSESTPVCHLYTNRLTEDANKDVTPLSGNTVKDRNGGNTPTTRTWSAGQVKAAGMWTSGLFLSNPQYIQSWKRSSPLEIGSMGFRRFRRDSPLVERDDQSVKAEFVFPALSWQE
jgi:hypothetical protein